MPNRAITYEMIGQVTADARPRKGYVELGAE
jgi:hypothetical protein